MQTQPAGLQGALPPTTKLAQSNNGGKGSKYCPHRGHGQHQHSWSSTLATITRPACYSSINLHDSRLLQYMCPAAVPVGHLLTPGVPAAAAVAGGGILTPYDLAKLYHSCLSSSSCCCSSANCSAASRRSLRHLKRHTRYTAAVAHIHTVYHLGQVVLLLLFPSLLLLSSAAGLVSFGGCPPSPPEPGRALLLSSPPPAEAGQMRDCRRCRCLGCARRGVGLGVRRGEQCSPLCSIQDCCASGWVFRVAGWWGEGADCAANAQNLSSRKP